MLLSCFFFQAEDGIRDAQESRGLGDVYKRQGEGSQQGARSRRHRLLPRSSRDREDDPPGGADL